MAKLGWGTPTLVSLSLGIIIEIPGNIAIIGVLRVALPADDVAVVVLQVNFIGAMEFDKSRGWFFASLFDSRVLFITIDGEMGAVGGVRRQRQLRPRGRRLPSRVQPAAAALPGPRRIAIDILNTSVARIRAEGYFAVTTNTVQFGCVAEAFLGFSSLNVSGLHGHGRADSVLAVLLHDQLLLALLGQGLRYRGLGVADPARGRGPDPMAGPGFGRDLLAVLRHRRGHRRHLGRAAGHQPAADRPAAPAGQRAEKPDSWRPVPPLGASILVSLRTLPEAEAQVALHPLGTLQISQRFAPLDAKLDRVGAQRPSDANRFSLTASSPTFAKRGDVDEKFAPAQFEDLSDDERAVPQAVRGPARRR